MKRWSVFCDFDGTICIPDSCDFLLQQFAPPEWKDLDQAVWERRLTEREAFGRQIALLRVDWDTALKALAQGVRMREGFGSFVAYCHERDIPLKILSSGLRPLIEDILHREGLDGMPVAAHDLRIENNRWHVVPMQERRIEDHCGHCKCVQLEDARLAGRNVIFIGDGFTDICPSRRADVLFATDVLADETRRTGRDFHCFQTFYDVERILDEILK